MIKVMYSSKPDPIKYMLKPNGLADVWLRTNIKTETASLETDGGQYQYWTLDSPLSKAEVEENFYALALDKEKLEKELTEAVQGYMDSVAKTRGYDNMLSVCTYNNSGNAKFDAEGEACRRWRSAVWAACYAIMADVLAGKRLPPSKEELLAELPEIVW